MYLIEIFKLLVFFLIIFCGVYNIGKIINYKTFKRDAIDLNIVLGFICLSTISSLALILKFFDIRILFFTIFLSYLIFFNSKLSYFKNKFNYKNLSIFTILLIIFFISLKNNFYLNDDLGGYFYSINNFINNSNIYTTELEHRVYYSFPLFLILNSLFVSISDFYSAWFFDIFFGTALILFCIYRNFRSNNKNFFFIIIFTILFATLSYQETSTPKLITIGLIIIILFEIENFFKNNKFLITALVFSSILIIFKFTNLASFTNILIFVILIEKLFKGKIKLKELFLPFLISILIIFPWSIYSLQIFETPLSAIFDSKYYYTQNYFFQELNLDFIRTKNIFEYIYSRQIILTLILSLIYFFICKDKKNYKFYLIFSFILCYLFYLIIMYSDKSNFLRYMNQFFVSYSCYLFFKIFNVLIKKKINFKNIFMIILVCLVCVRVNQNITIFFNNSFNNFSYLLTNDYNKYYKNVNKYFKINELYPSKYQKILADSLKDNINLKDKTLLFISRPYLFNFKNNKNIKYIEFGYGYALTIDPYPIHQSTKERINFFKKKGIKYVLFEKKYINHNDGLVKRFLDNKKNQIIDNFGIERGSHELTLFFDDLANFLLNEVNKSIILENEFFILYKLKI